jgi:hypothetical protein
MLEEMLAGFTQGAVVAFQQARLSRKLAAGVAGFTSSPMLFCCCCHTHLVSIERELTLLWPTAITRQANVELLPAALLVQLYARQARIYSSTTDRLTPELLCKRECWKALTSDRRAMQDEAKDETRKET